MIVQPSLHLDPGGSSSSSIRPFSFSDTLSSNNHKNTKNQKNISFSSSHFASMQSSPEPSSSISQLISVATLNVRGISKQSKFDSLFQDFLSHN